MRSRAFDANWHLCSWCAIPKSKNTIGGGCGVCEELSKTYTTHFLMMDGDYSHRVFEISNPSRFRSEPAGSLNPHLWRVLPPQTYRDLVRNSFVDLQPKRFERRVRQGPVRTKREHEIREACPVTRCHGHKIMPT